MLDILSIGTVTIDLYYKGATLTHDKDRFELAIGGKYYADHFFEGLGGGAANTAIGIIKNGFSCGLMAKIGNNPFKKNIIEKLEAAKVEYKQFCTYEENYTNISSILLTEKGEKTVINYRTPHEHIIKTDEDYKMIDQAQVIYMANLSMVPMKERISVLQYAKEKGKRTIANLNVTDCRRSIEEIRSYLEYVDIFIINTHEFADIVKTNYKTIDFHSKITGKYSPFRENMVLVVTDGGKGSYAYYDGKVYHEKAVPEVKVTDSTGAGDGYTASFIVHYLKTGDIQDSMKSASQYSTKILTRLGAN
jgi:sugar/nucleoside kinase (ribokinase family)